MAFLEVRHRSSALNKETAFNLIMPDIRIEGRELPVIYLLHGYSDSESSWCRNTLIERYVRNKYVAVVMPDAVKSFYTDYPKDDLMYYKYISCELPAFVNSQFGFSNKREHNYLAGISMGGFGAFKIALNNPDRYCAAVSFSGCLDLKSKAVKDSGIINLFEEHYGEIKNTENDLFYVADKVSRLAQKPRLYQWCGTEDFLYQDNIKFRDYIAPLGFDYTYSECVGSHDWEYWEKQIEPALDWFQI